MMVMMMMMMTSTTAQKEVVAETTLTEQALKICVSSASVTSGGTLATNSVLHLRFIVIKSKQKRCYVFRHYGGLPLERCCMSEDGAEYLSKL